MNVGTYKYNLTLKLLLFTNTNMYIVMPNNENMFSTLFLDPYFSVTIFKEKGGNGKKNVYQKV